MYRVTLSYTIKVGNTRHYAPDDSWLSRADTPELAIYDAQSNVGVVARTRYGPYAEVIYHLAETTEMVTCCTCHGEGLVHKFAGSMHCPTCLGKKYLEAEHAKECV